MKALPLEGKAALVTASSRTTGAVIASSLARAGASTAIHYYRSQDEAEALAVELAPHVTVNAIAPGQIEDSELIDQIDPNYKRILRQESPLKRLVTRQEVADTVVLLCGDPFASVTGQTLRLDAGWTIPTWKYRVGAVEWQEDS
jgi:NAD(P)-dependent dehydrogenase (short-subunit alcohol dehydrogenase family)